MLSIVLEGRAGSRGCINRKFCFALWRRLPCGACEFGAQGRSQGRRYTFWSHVFIEVFEAVDEIMWKEDEIRKEKRPRPEPWDVPACIPQQGGWSRGTGEAGGQGEGWVKVASERPALSSISGRGVAAAGAGVRVSSFRTLRPV